jgi:hypothetical protein
METDTKNNDDHSNGDGRVENEKGDNSARDTEDGDVKKVIYDKFLCVNTRHYDDSFQIQEIE